MDAWCRIRAGMKKDFSGGRIELASRFRMGLVSVCFPESSFSRGIAWR